MDFYISGDVAPSGRFKYSYISTHENATGEPAPETLPAETQQPDEPTNEANEPTVDSTDNGTSDGGCASVVSMGAATLLMAMAATFVMRKKHN